MPPHTVRIHGTCPKFAIAVFLFLPVSLLLPATRAREQIAMTEVLKDPYGPESGCPGGRCHEFVELLNLGDDTLEVSGIFVSDGTHVDSIIPFPDMLTGHEDCLYNSDLLLPGRFALILDRDYAESPIGGRFHIADSTLLLTVGSASIAGGLTADKGIFVFRGARHTIVDSLAAALDPGEAADLLVRHSHHTPSGVHEGHSLVPESLLKGSAAWVPCPDSLSPGRYKGMSNGWICEYEFSAMSMGSPALPCSVWVLAAGERGPEGATWQVRQESSRLTCASGMVPGGTYPAALRFELPGDSCSYDLTIAGHDRETHVHLDRSAVWIPYASVRINEIYPRAGSGQAEWFELVNTATASVNLKHWRCGTVEGTDTITSTDLLLGPGEFLVLTRDAAQFSRLFPATIAVVQPGAWHSLDNYADTLTLISAFADTACETVWYSHTWFDAWDRQSLARTSLTGSGACRDSWVLANRPTPGQPNAAAAWRSAAYPSMEIGPIPFTPNGDRKNDLLAIRMSVPASWDCSICIYGFDARKLLDVPGPLAETFLWDGRTSSGAAAPAGPFFVVAIAGNGGRERVLRQKGILWR